MNEETKQCTKCKQPQPFLAYSADRRSSDGLQTRCKECDRKGKLEKYRALTPVERSEYIRKQAPRSKARQSQRKILGLCQNCDQPAIQGTNKCPEHAHQHRVAVKQTRLKRVELGLCARCGHQPIHQDHTRVFRRKPTHCSKCMTEQRKANKKKWAKRKWKTSPEIQKAEKIRLQNEVITEYGGKCACCGETGRLFLSMDHIFNDGAEHRRQLWGRPQGGSIYRWLRRQGYPKERFQVLCMSCNYAKRLNGGRCPHETDPKNHPRPAWKVL